MSTDRSRLWDGCDDPYGPAARRAFGDPQPSEPTPATGAPYIAPPTSQKPELEGDPS